MTTPAQPMIALSVGGVLCLAKLWEIERTDGEVLRFTSHNKTLVYDGEEYTPAGGMSASAVEREEGLKPANFEAFGYISSAALTHDDFRAGLYRGAQITERTVDWRYPWAGTRRVSVYDIADTEFSHETWVAHCQSRARRLDVVVGNVFQKHCRWPELGDEFCGVNLAAFTQTGTVLSVTTARRVFTCAFGDAKEDNYYRDGKATWATGPNAGIVSNVKSNLLSANTVSLHLKTPYDIAAGHTFSIHPGCDRQLSTCRDVFNNLNRHGGFIFLPGNDDYFKTPDAKG